MHSTQRRHYHFLQIYLVALTGPTEALITITSVVGIGLPHRIVERHKRTSSV